MLLPPRTRNIALVFWQVIEAHCREKHAGIAVPAIHSPVGQTLGKRQPRLFAHRRVTDLPNPEAFERTETGFGILHHGRQLASGGPASSIFFFKRFVRRFANLGVLDFSNSSLQLCFRCFDLFRLSSKCLMSLALV